MTPREALLDACPYRRVVDMPPGDTALCGLIERLAGANRSIDARVCRQACEACLRRPAATPGHVNAVVASLLHRALTAAPAGGCDSDLAVAEQRFLQKFAVQHLEVAESNGMAAAAGAARTPRIANHEPANGGIVGWLNQIHRAAMRKAARMRNWPSIGLIGWNTRTGLGYQNRDIAAHIPITQWLIPSHPRQAPLPLPLHLRHRVWQTAGVPVEGDLRPWLGNLDWLLFVEAPLVAGLTRLAKEAGVRVACVCNWELTCPLASAWLGDVDLLICPTQFTFDRMRGWKERFGFAWKMVHAPWPIDIRPFRFRQRSICRRFVFVNGAGGCRGRLANGQLTSYRRKGLEVLFAAAHLVRHVPIIVYSQADVPLPPTNVELRPPPSHNARLYEDGDVCIQSSHWEGLGLPLLECQAAGMPLITTDGPPMNEHQPFRTIPVAKVEPVYLAGRYPVPAQVMDPHHLASTLTDALGADICDASMKARGFVESEHSWERAGQVLRSAFQQELVSTSP
jgi:glycosyltransferase involved in cell wall biosynthesis